MLIQAQAIIATIGLVALTIWPPTSGAMLLVPIAGTDVNGVAKIALAGGAALLGSGPFPGSLVVVGQRSSIARHIGWNIVILAAPPAGCGARGADAAPV